MNISKEKFDRWARMAMIIIAIVNSIFIPLFLYGLNQFAVVKSDVEQLKIEQAKIETKQTNFEKSFLLYLDTTTKQHEDEMTQQREFEGRVMDKFESYDQNIARFYEKYGHILNPN